MSNILYSYILLPTFSYRPEDLPLGTLIPELHRSHHPDPSLPLVEVDKFVPPAAHDIRTELEEPKDAPWSYVGSLKKGASAGFSLDLPFVSPVNIGFDLSRSTGNGIKIECRRVETRSFRPSRSFLATTLRDEFVQEYARGFPRPSIFMVTGVKISEGVKVEVGRGITQNASGNFGVDMTSLGAPVKLGPTGGKTNDSHGLVRTEFPGPLVLAYQLKEIKLKRNGTSTIKDYTQDAKLFAGDNSEVLPPQSDDFVDNFDIQDLIATDNDSDLSHKGN